ncbi:MAG: hypothetical protein IKW90_01545 [Lachnospiraceae bacterium]|nr:hypothetical protein [Lachnospiraceae bacterium]
MKKYLLVIIMFSLIAFGLTGRVRSYADDRVDKCTIKVSVDDKKIDLSGLVLDIYSAECTYSDTKSGTHVYSEYYDKSVNLDSEFCASFDRPSEKFLVSVRLDSIPKGYGTPVNSYFFFEDTDSYTFKLSKVSKVDIVQNLEDPFSEKWDLDKVECYDKNSKLLIVNNEILSKQVDLVNKSVIDKETERDLYFNYEYEVLVGDDIYSISKQYNVHCPNNISKAEYLYKGKYISEYDYMNVLAGFMLYGDRYMDEGYTIECETEDLLRLFCYRNNHKDKKNDYGLIDEALASYEISAYNNRSSATAYSPSGKFKIHYESSEMSYGDAVTLGSVFDSADTYLCGTLNLPRPFNPNTTTYDVNIVSVSSANYAGATVPHNDGTSEIYVRVDYAYNIISNSGPSGFEDCYKGIVAHEYMHAILYGKYIYDTWINESLATWAGMVFESDYYLYKYQDVRDFLHAPRVSLDVVNNVNNRHYGSGIFFLYISKMIGSNVIKKAIDSYSSSGSLSAISSGLTYYGSSLSEAYSGCACYNCDADWFYNTNLGNTNCKWGGALSSSQSTFPTYTTEVLPYLSAYYIKYNGSSTPKTLTINVSFLAYSGSPVAGIKAVRTNSSNNKYAEYPTINSNICTIVKQSFGDNTTKHYTIIPMNVATSGVLAFTAIAQVN